MLDCEPPETDDPSDAESGGVSAPEELEVHVLERDRAAETGLLKMERSRTTPKPISTRK